MTDLVDATGQTVTRTQTTEERYATIARRLIRASACERQIGIGDVTLADVADLVLARTSDGSRATLRQYRAAVRYAIEQGWLSDDGTWHRLATPPAAHGHKRGRATSAYKRKRIADRDLTRLDAALRHSRSRYAIDLRAYLLANRLVGLRVCEWASARYVADHPETGAPALILRCAKATNGRAHGPERTLHLGNMSRSAVKVIAFCAKRLSSRAEDASFEAWQTGASKLLYRLSRRLWPRRKRQITLYSCRHAFAARAKTVLSQVDVAALMGHASDRTAGENYARKLQGGHRCRPQSLPHAERAEVARVRDTGRSYQTRHRPSAGMPGGP